MRRVSVILAIAISFSWLAPAPISAQNFSNRERVPISSSNNSVSAQTLHDIAILNILPSSLLVSQGTVVSVDVTMHNLGGTDETFILDLQDDTDARSITSVTLTLAPGQTLTLGLPWGTSRATSGFHSLTATADLPSDQIPGNNSATASPIEIVQSSIVLGDGTGLDLPDASFGGALSSPNIASSVQPPSSVFVAGPGITFGQTLNRAGVSATNAPYGGIYVANADATFAPSSKLSNPFLRGEFQGNVHLQGQLSGAGAYIQVGVERHLVDFSSSFRFSLPSGTYDLVIQAPGYVPVRVLNATINSGELITLPDLTLPFGDANGDGKIDILDLSIAASNFGSVIQDIPPP